MKAVTRAILVGTLSLWTGFLAAAVESVTRDPAGVLTSYLSSSKARREAEAQALTVVKKAQIIFLQYERDTPTESPAKDTAFALSLKASHVTPIDYHENGKTYPRISVTFSKLFGDDKDMTREQWLEEMKRPIQAGYKLKSVSVVYTPPPDVKKASLAKSQSVGRRLVDELSKMKSDFGQLSEYSPTSLKPGSWEEGDWPHYSHLTYKHAVGPDRKGSREKYSDDWCSLWFAITPITGNPRQRVFSKRQYPMQGIEAEWSIESGSDHLNEKFKKIVTNSLKELDALEAELSKRDPGAKQDAPADADRPRR